MNVSKKVNEKIILNIRKSNTSDVHVKSEHVEQDEGDGDNDIHQKSRGEQVRRTNNANASDEDKERIDAREDFGDVEYFRSQSTNEEESGEGVMLSPLSSQSLSKTKSLDTRMETISDDGQTTSKERAVSSVVKEVDLERVKEEALGGLDGSYWEVDVQSERK
tara:strand:+ start:999 stop:1487 length:489 start_codon:yes stop_codon:yes gene_type:complete